MLCNVERHTSAPARSESWGVDDVQVDCTGLVLRPHRSSRGRVQLCTPKVSLALTSLDPRWGRIIRAIVVRSLSNSSKLKSSCGRVRPSFSGHSCWTPSCFVKKVLKHVKPCMRQAGVMTDQVDGWEQRSPLNSRFLPIRGHRIRYRPSRRSPSSLFQRSLAVHARGQSINQFH